ncbi:MAG: TonB-dependent receptor [Gammaproteobacteria bacterium]|jgi:iron complex outermembrane receptor protein|nr:MAG: TonB-dependent receptor [Gammaproteobacteria bacterium]
MKILKQNLALVAILTIFNPLTYAQSDGFFEDVIVTAEKRNESLQDVSQAITALTSSEIEAKGIDSIVDLTSIVPGVTVAKNEGYKTVISVRGVGNETNQNAIAAPSVAYHIDGIFIASPFSLQTDFIGVDRIEVLRGPQGTLFGQNSTGGAINVVTKAPSLNESYSSGSLTLGEYNMTKLSGSASGPIFENVAATFSFTKTKRDGFSTNIFNGQDLDDDDSYSVRNDYFIDLDDSSSLRIFGQYANIDSNGSAMKGLDDTTVGARNLKQDSLSELKLTSSVLAGIYEKDLGYANLKVLASSQSDSISVRRDNDRHFYQDAAPSLTGVSTYQRSEYRFETSDVKTKTFEINLISNEPLIDGKLDWTVGAFYMDQEIENHIREYLDEFNSGTNAAGQDGVFKYVCGEPFADPNYCVSLPTGFGPGQTNPYAASTEFGFITDAFPERRSLSIFGQTTYSFDDDLRLISGFRYTRDNFLTDVSNFFGVELYQEDDTDEETSGRLTLEYDLDADSMVYLSQTRGFKPGGTNLTFGASGDGTPAMVLPTFKSETLDSTELGFKTEFFDGRALANIAIFDYTYKNLQVQGTDPDVFKGGVVNIPESEVQGLELEFTASLSDSWTIDANFAYLDSEITSSFEYLDNAKAQQYSFGGESNRYALREDVKGKELAKTPEITADISLIYSTQLASGDVLNSSLQFVKRGKFFQRIVNNPVQDPVDGYEIINFSSGVDYASGWGFDIMVTNVGDEDGMNSAMTDVFGVGATGIEYIPPRQVMTRLSYDF